jgi:adenylate cyclase
MHNLSRTALSALTGCGEGQLLQFEMAGIIERKTDYHLEDADRIRVALALHEAGIPLDTLVKAIRNKVFALDFAAQTMFDPVYLSTTSMERELEGLDVTPVTLNNLRAAAGLPRLSGEQILREDDVELLKLIAECRRLGISDPAMTRVLRAFGQSTHRVVETMRDLFRSEVEERMLNAGISHSEMLSAAAAKRLELQRIGFRVLFMLQRRLLEESVFDNIVSRIQEALCESGLETRPDVDLPTVAFADLCGFTELTHELGDLKAAEQAAHFEAFAQQIVSPAGGRLVKVLGDGVMILFPEPTSGLSACLRLVESAEKAGLLPVRVGLATGQVVPRDGDIFGQTVNLAARISSIANPAQVLVSESAMAAVATSNPGMFNFAAMEPTLLKGLPGRFCLFSVDITSSYES